MIPGPVIAIAVVGVIIGASIFICWCVIIICCCIKRRNYHSQTEFRRQAPVVVTSATHTAPGGYTVSQMPLGATTTTTYQTQVYAAPYPPQGVPTQMPMPMPMPGGQPPAPGIQPHMAPYPPMPAPANMNPPSYDMAVSGGGAGAPNHTAYEKQSAYNPSYPMQ